MKNGATVREFEQAFAQYVGAKHAIGLSNGTATLHTALVAVGAKAGDSVAVPPLTMSATTIAALHAGAVPVFFDVDERTWLMRDRLHLHVGAHVSVSLYGLHAPRHPGVCFIDDAAQTLRPHNEGAAFTSYSFQASKILSTGEGGMLVTDDEALAVRAREFSSLGYRMRADQPRIDPDAIKSPTFDRHHSLGWNYRMNDVTAAAGLLQLDRADELIKLRRQAADLYVDIVAKCEWLTPQHVPDGWTHDYWTYAVACDTPERASALADAVVRKGGERPYPAWRLAYDEPAFVHLTSGAFGVGHTGAGSSPARSTVCPVAESLQPRLLQFQTNSLESAWKNAKALLAAVRELS